MQKSIEYLVNMGTITDTDLVRGCFSPEGSLEFQSAFPIYQICVEFFANVLGVRLLEFYLNSSDTDLKNKALQLLTFSLSMSSFSAYALIDLKHLLLLCFRKHSRIDKIEGEADLCLLRNIVYSVTKLLFSTNQTWPELGYCLRDLANSEPLLGFYIFLDLPTSLTWEFLVLFYRDLQDEATKRVTMPHFFGTEEIISAFATLVYIGVQLNQPYIIHDCTPVLDVIGDATRMLLNDTVYLSVKELSRLLQRNIEAYSCYPEQKRFVFKVVYEMIRTSLPVETQVALVKLLELAFLR